MAKILSTTMGIYADFVHFPGFQSENAWTQERGKNVVTGRYFARSEWESLLGFTASDLASAGNGHYGHVGNPLASSGDFKEGTMQHSQELHAKGSRPASSNITQEHTWQVWGHCKQATKGKTILQHRQWHGIGLSWTAHYRQEFQLIVRQEGWAVGARLGNKTKYKRPRRCTSKKETFVPLSPQTWKHQ